MAETRRGYFVDAESEQELEDLQERYAWSGLAIEINEDSKTFEVIA